MTTQSVSSPSSPQAAEMREQLFGYLSVSRASSPPLDERFDLISRMPFQLFNLVMPHLNKSEIARLAAQNSIISFHTMRYRESAKQLDLSHMQISSEVFLRVILEHPKLTSLNLSHSFIADEDLEMALDRLPHLRKIDLSGCLHITGKGVQALAHFVRGKKMHKVDVSGKYTSRFDRAYPVSLSRAKQIEQFIRRGEPFPIDEQEEILFDQVLNHASDYFDHMLSIEDKLALAKSIETVSKDDWNLLIDCLDFSELEYFDISNTSFRFGETQACQMIAKMKSGAELKVCKTSSSPSDPLSSFSIKQLIKALPIRQLTELDVHGRIDSDNIEQLAFFLQQNTVLERLTIREADVDRIKPLLAEDLIHLLHSVNSRSMRSFWYESHSEENNVRQNITDDPEVQLTMLRKMSDWPLIEKVNVDNSLSLYKLQKMLQDVSGSDASDIFVDSWSELQKEVRTIFRPDGTTIVDTMINGELVSREISVVNKPASSIKVNLIFLAFAASILLFNYNRILGNHSSIHVNG
jgi:hypothetical protein